MIKQIFLIGCVFFVISLIYADAWPELETQMHRDNFRNNASCKISPLTKVLLSIPQDRDFEKKYIIDDDELLRVQCHRDVVMDVYLQTDTGIYKTHTSYKSTHPLCNKPVALVNTLLWGGRKDFPKELLLPGTFLTEPLILDKNRGLMVGNFHDGPIPKKIPMLEEDVEFLTQNWDFSESDREQIETENAYNRYGKAWPPYIDVSKIPECEPNIRTKK